MRTTNGIERSIQYELMERTKKYRNSLDVEAIICLVADPLVEIDGECLIEESYVTRERKMTDR